MRTTRATRHASSKRMVALTFAAWEAHESFRDRGTPGSAARWKTTSIPATARRHTSASQRSPRRNSIAPSWPARFAASPVLRLSTTRTWWPSATNRSATWEPIRPAPPVTSHRDARAASMEYLAAPGFRPAEGVAKSGPGLRREPKRGTRRARCAIATPAVAPTQPQGTNRRLQHRPEAPLARIGGTALQPGSGRRPVQPERHLVQQPEPVLSRPETRTSPRRRLARPNERAGAAGHGERQLRGGGGTRPVAQHAAVHPSALAARVAGRARDAPHGVVAGRRHARRADQRTAGDGPHRGRAGDAPSRIHGARRQFNASGRHRVWGRAAAVPARRALERAWPSCGRASHRRPGAGGDGRAFTNGSSARRESAAPARTSLGPPAPRRRHRLRAPATRRDGRGPRAARAKPRVASARRRAGSDRGPGAVKRAARWRPAPSRPCPSSASDTSPESAREPRAAARGPPPRNSRTSWYSRARPQGESSRRTRAACRRACADHTGFLPPRDRRSSRQPGVPKQRRNAWGGYCARRPATGG